MVRNSDKTYGELIEIARNITDKQEVGETYEGVEEQFAKIFSEAIEGNRKKGVTGDYYIWIRVQKDMYAQNALRMFPMCRRTRPSPYETEDHYLWKYRSEGSQLIFQWCIPRKEITAYVLNNPNNFDPDYVRLLKRYQQGKLDSEYTKEWTEIERLHRNKIRDSFKMSFKDFALKI